MMNTQQPGQENGMGVEHTTKIVLTLVFLAGFILFVLLTGTERLLGSLETWSWVDFILLGLATMRLGRMVAFDRVMEPFRAPVAQTVPDLSGAGDTVIARGKGVQRALGQLVSCPICVGTWIAAGLTGLLVWFPVPARVFLWMIAAVALAEVLHALVEAWTWTGVMNRTVTGVHCLERDLRKAAENTTRESGPE